MSIVVKLLILVNIFSNVLSLGIPEITNLALVGEGLIDYPGKDTLHIKCETKGDEPITYKWLFNDKEITNSGRGYSLREGDLRYFGVTKEQQGVYKCLATNNYGTVFNQINVTLHYMGKFDEDSDVSKTKVVSVKYGEPVRLDCPPHTEGSGNVYLWGYLKDSGPTYWKSGDYPLQNAFITKHGTLTYSSFTKKDAENINAPKGVSCILYRKESVESARITVVASPGTPQKAKPTLEEYIPKNTTTSKDFGFLCGAVGYPQPTITWYKNDVKITGDITKDGGNFSIQGNGMRLQIEPMTLEAEGMYKCVAENSEGIDQKSGYLTVHESPYFKTRMNNVENVTFEKKLTLTCDGAGRPAVKYEWYHNNTILLASDTKRYTLKGNKLTIESADFQHGGLFLCVISNYLKVAVQAVFVRVGAIPPTLLNGLKDPTYVFKDNTNNISCYFKSAPAPTLSWFKDGANINVTRISLEGRGLSTLQMNNPTDSDSGRYKCKAENVKGEDEGQAEVVAVVKTVITKAPQPRTFKVGASGSIFCDAVYEKEKLDPVFQWQKNRQKVSEDENVFIEKRITQPKRVLFFRNVPLSAGGTYTCRVYTEDQKTKIQVSEDKRSADVIVIGEPMKPSELTFNGNCTAVDNITLSWKQENHFGHKISYYTVDYAGYNSDEKWTLYKADNEITDTSVVLKTDKLPPNAELKFRITAVINYEGTTYNSSKVIAPDNCKTPIGPPIVSPIVTAKTDGPGTLIVTWDDSNLIEQPEPNYGVFVTYRKLPDGEEVTRYVNDTNKLVIPDAGVDQEYEVFVQSRNDKGKGPKSEPYRFKSGGEKITEAPRNVQFKDNKDNVSITWEPVKYARTYKVYYKKGEKGGRRRRRNTADEGVKEVSATSEAAVLMGLAPSQQYDVTVSAANDEGEGPESEPAVSFETSKSVPGVPGNVDLNSYGDALHVTWQPPPSSDVDTYVLTWYKTDEVPPKKFTKNYTGDAREGFIVDGLDPLSYYTVELTAVNSEGPGKAYKFDKVAVSTPDMPGKPAAPTYRNINETTKDIVFKLPDTGYIGGLPDTFTIYYYPKGGDKSKAKNVSGTFPSNTNVTIFALDDGRAYMLYTVGVNAIGEGTQSDETTANPFQTISVVPQGADESKPFYKELWFIILLILILLIIIIALIICCCMNRRGGKYPVGAKEKDRGGWDNQPLKDYAEDPNSGDMSTPILKNGKNNPVRSASDISLKDPVGDEDKDSLDDYGEESKFNEDGSFIGQYGGENNKKAPPSEINGATMV